MQVKWDIRTLAIAIPQILTIIQTYAQTDAKKLLLRLPWSRKVYSRRMAIYLAITGHHKLYKCTKSHMPKYNYKYHEK